MSLRTHILNVGRADSIILELPRDDGATVLGFIDCCDFQMTQQYLIDNGLDTPDLVQFVVATHPHYDHIGGIQELLEMFQNNPAGPIPVYMFWDSGHEHTSLTYENLTEYLANNPGIITWYPRTGLQVLFGRLGIRVLSPPDPLPTGTASDCNNASIVLHLTYGRAKLLFAGDAQFANWASCCVDQPDYLSAQVIKLSHHGSKHGTFLEALEAVNPRIAIISGENSMNPPRGGFPHDLTMEALNELGVSEIRCTYDHGNIVIESRANAQHIVTP
ncbi:MAG: ComEC/Rec2 family competence protein [Promethearchaeota archaeon]